MYRRAGAGRAILCLLMPAAAACGSPNRGVKDWEDADGPTRRSLILHEVTHAMLAPVTSPVVPDWVVEGVAVYFSSDPGLEVIRREPELLQENSLAEIAGQRGRMSPSDYAISGAPISHLVERYGEKEVLNFLASFDEEQTDKELDEVDSAMIRYLETDSQGAAIGVRLLEKQFGITLDQLDTAAKDWIRARI